MLSSVIIFGFVISLTYANPLSVNVPELPEVLCGDYPICYQNDGSKKCCPFHDGICCASGGCCPNGHHCHPLKRNYCSSQPYNSSIFNLQISKRNLVICPDGSYCPETYTCCLMSNDRYGCCPYEGGVCCPDKAHCCPHSTVCADNGQCKPNKANELLFETRKRPISSFIDLKSNSIFQEKVSGVTCPDNETYCEEGSCCLLIDFTYGCCPYDNGVCCADRMRCCPEGTVCSDDSSTCETPDFIDKLKSQNIKANKSVQKLRDRNIICPDGASVCSDSSTCCSLPNSAAYACCPMENAVCCGDGVHCCPEGFSCDVESLQCRPESASRMLWGMLYKKPTKLMSIPRREARPQTLATHGSSCEASTCLTSSGQTNCCPFKEAICCAGGRECCPSGYACSSTGRSCIPLQP